MYNAFSVNYDRFVNWQERLAFELPFLESQLQLLVQDGVLPRVLDSACGTGQHALALAQRGYPAAGADYAAGMIEQAEKNRAAMGLNVPFAVAGFGEMAGAFGEESFDALLCLGNSLPHVITPGDLLSAVKDFAAVLRPGGLLLIQNRNFDAVLSSRERWMGPQPASEGDREWLFVRFYDFLPDGTIDFNILTLYRQGTEPWRQQAAVTRLMPWREVELTQVLARCGFTDISLYGGLDGSLFSAGTSGNLVISARKG